MPDASHITSFDRQLGLLSKYHSAERYLFIHKQLLTHADIGPIAALVYSVILDKFHMLTYNKDEDHASYRWLQKNGGWFHISQTEISKISGLSVDTVRKNLPKIIGKLLVEKKMIIDNCERSVYNLIQWNLTTPSSTANGGMGRNTIPDSQGQGGYYEIPSGIVRNTIHTRVHNKELHNIKTNIRVREEEIPRSKRVDRPKNKTNSTHSKFVELASKWEPKLSKSPITEKQISRAANVLQKLVEEFGFSFNDLELGIEWAYNDTVPQKSGFCWRKYFKTLTGLDKRNTGSQTNTEDVKFQKIHDARLRAAQNDPDAIYAERVEAIVRKFWDEPGDEPHVQRCLDDVEWFYHKLESINKQRISKHKFTWHDGEAFIKVVEFLIDVEANSKKTFKIVMSAYLEFMQYKLQDGTVQTLYPGYFTRTSEIFRQYLAEDFNVTGRMLVDWQKGDFDE